MNSVDSVRNKSVRFLVQRMLILLFIPIFCSFWPFSGEGETTFLSVKTSLETNDGRPFYLFVKEVEKGEFLRDEYQSIVREAFSGSPSIQPFLIFPGENYDFKILRKQNEKPLGIYVLYTDPGADWKMIANGSNQVIVVLGDSEILSASVR